MVTVHIQLSPLCIPEERAEHKAMSILQQKACCQVPGGVKRHEPKGPAFSPGMLWGHCKEWSGACRAAGLEAGAPALAKYDKRST